MTDAEVRNFGRQSARLVFSILVGAVIVGIILGMTDVDRLWAGVFGGLWGASTWYTTS